jgi:hypothetical protein
VGQPDESITLGIDWQIPKENRIYLTVNTELSWFKERPSAFVLGKPAWIVDSEECSNDRLFQLIIYVQND